MESECICPTCRKIFQDTAQLPCGHVFCKKCLEKHEIRGNKQLVECFVCSAPYSLDKHRTSSIYHETILSELDPHKKQDCFMCEDMASLICQEITCGLLLCLDCHDKHHAITKHTRTHKVRFVFFF